MRRRPVIEIPRTSYTKERSITRIDMFVLPGPWRWRFDDVALQTSAQISRCIEAFRQREEVTLIFRDKFRMMIRVRVDSYTTNTLWTGETRFTFIGTEEPRRATQKATARRSGH